VLAHELHRPIVLVSQLINTTILSATSCSRFPFILPLMQTNVLLFFKLLVGLKTYAVARLSSHIMSITWTEIPR